MQPTAALPGLLRELAAGLESGRIRGPAADRLEREANNAFSCAERDSGVRRLAEYLDRGLESPWALAVRVADALTAFEKSTAWSEIGAGTRKPRTSLEAIMAIILRCPGPRSARRLHDIILGI